MRAVWPAPMRAVALADWPSAASLAAASAQKAMINATDIRIFSSALSVS
jgi:hypothetical protein